MAKLTQVDFPPRECVSYSKETQTPVMTQTKEGDSLNVVPVTLEKHWQRLCVHVLNCALECVSEYKAKRLSKYVVSLVANVCS